MEDGIYRMSLAEGFLVLIVIGLWLLAVRNFVRKLERICNPPSIFLDYSTLHNISLSPSTLHNCYQNKLIRPSPIHFARATSEPAIDASPRTTIHKRSPSETCLHSKTSLSQPMSSSSKLKLERSNSSLNLPRHSGYHIHVETIANKLKPLQKPSYPKRLPSIVKRSLLDVHRRALFSNISLDNSMTQCVVIANDNRTMRIPLMKKNYQRGHTIDGDSRYKGNI